MRACSNRALSSNLLKEGTKTTGRKDYGHGVDCYQVKATSQPVLVVLCCVSRLFLAFGSRFVPVQVESTVG
jgi:hypothetical protein